MRQPGGKIKQLFEKTSKKTADFLWLAIGFDSPP